MDLFIEMFISGSLFGASIVGMIWFAHAMGKKEKE